MSWKRKILVKRALLRHNCPGSLSTGIHDDQLFLRGGEAEFLTAWVPIGDCAATGGGLMYLEDSCRLGEEIEEKFTQRAKDLSAEERINAFNQNMMQADSSLRMLRSLGESRPVEDPGGWWVTMKLGMWCSIGLI